MNITIQGKEYEVLEYQSAEVVRSLYPNIADRGVVAMYTVKRRKRIYTVNQFQSGNFSKPWALPAALGGSQVS